jgi:hypothetical protein
MSATMVTVRRSQALAMRSQVGSAPSSLRWRLEDPPATTVGELSPDDLGGRVVIRAAMGTIYGDLVGIRPHPSIPGHSLVGIEGKPVLALRDDFEAIVLDDVRPVRQP